jgi:hypothetical protein
MLADDTSQWAAILEVDLRYLAAASDLVRCRDITCEPYPDPLLRVQGSHVRAR